MPEISFSSLEEDYQFESAEKVSGWIERVCELERKSIDSLDYIFVNDEYLLSINQKYLNHDTLTDIVTFNLGEENQIEGEIYISLERVAENASKFDVAPKNELNRVIVHGLLHLLGYDDHSAEEKEVMRSKEDYYLSIL